MVLRLMYEPQELVDTSNLSNEEWLSYRRRGIGGSDAAVILGISPWRTARDLYYDKLSVVKADMDENWVALEMGHLLEDLVARIFAKKTGLHIFQRKVMFQHPLYPWMLADLDYLVELPDGSNAILEIKTTNYNARENWWYNGEEIVPVYYESQGRHYMSVMNLDRVYFCCLYGNNEDEVIIRHLDRDYEAVRAGGVFSAAGQTNATERWIWMREMRSCSFAHFAAALVRTFAKYRTAPALRQCSGRMRTASANATPLRSRGKSNERPQNIRDSCATASTHLAH